MFKSHVSIEAGYAPNVIPIGRNKPKGFLAGLGSEATDAQRNFLDFGQNLLETITGAKQQREARAQAVELSQVDAQRRIAETTGRSSGWAESTPWLVAGGTVAIIAIAALVLKK